MMAEYNSETDMNEDKARIPAIPAKGWIIIENSKSYPLTVVLEPRAAEHELLAGETVDVYLDEHAAMATTIQIHEDVVSIFSTNSAIYSGEKCIWDFHDFP